MLHQADFQGAERPRSFVAGLRTALGISLLLWVALIAGLIALLA